MIALSGAGFKGSLGLSEPGRGCAAHPIGYPGVVLARVDVRAAERVQDDEAEDFDGEWRAPPSNDTITAHCRAVFGVCKLELVTETAR